MSISSFAEDEDGELYVVNRGGSLNRIGWTPAFDVDGNGAVDALTDGLLLLRYLMGLRGAALIQGAVGAPALRRTAADIEAYIGSLVR